MKNVRQKFSNRTLRLSMVLRNQVSKCGVILNFSWVSCVNEWYSCPTLKYVLHICKTGMSTLLYSPNRYIYVMPHMFPLCLVSCRVIGKEVIVVTCRVRNMSFIPSLDFVVVVFTLFLYRFRLVLVLLLNLGSLLCLGGANSVKCLVHPKC